MLKKLAFEQGFRETINAISRQPHSLPALYKVANGSSPSWIDAIFPGKLRPEQLMALLGAGAGAGLGYGLSDARDVYGTIKDTALGAAAGTAAGFGGTSLARNVGDYLQSISPEARAAILMATTGGLGGYYFNGSQGALTGALGGTALGYGGQSIIDAIAQAQGRG